MSYHLYFHILFCEPWSQALFQTLSVQFSSVQSLSHVRLFVTPWTTARQASLFITNSWNPPKPTSIKSMMPSSHLILCCPLLLLPPIPPSIRVFSNESALRIRWPKYIISLLTGSLVYPILHRSGEAKAGHSSSAYSGLEILGVHSCFSPPHYLLLASCSSRPF